jgi:hypothetical protein
MRTFSRRQPVSRTFVALLIVALLWAAVTGAAAAEKADAGKSVPAQTDFQRLEGKWVRPDGGYVLELKSIKKDGSLAAAYFNPRPIRVFRAEIAKKNGTITLFVELRDVNYPGSTYNLTYDAATDRLIGTYFQAVENKTFNVQFLRVR